MLKGIPTILCPDLLKIMMEMGHGDEIIIADGNFPGASIAKRLVRCDGNNVPELLDAVLKFFPLDTYSQNPVSLMAVVPGDTVVPVIWDEYKTIVEKHAPQGLPFSQVEKSCRHRDLQKLTFLLLKVLSFHFQYTYLGYEVTYLDYSNFHNTLFRLLDRNHIQNRFHHP